MKFFRNQIVTKCIFIFMALHIFNLCVDVKDIELVGAPEDLSFNDQESVIEIILEQWLGFEDAISEHDEPDREDGGAIDFKKLTVIFYSCSFKKQALDLTVENDCTEHSFVYKPNFVQTPYLDIISPPPEA